MATVFFVLSLLAVLVLFGSVIASAVWLLIRTLRLLRRLFFKPPTPPGLQHRVSTDDRAGRTMARRYGPPNVAR
jgi:hypothetical protein